MATDKETIIYSYTRQQAIEDGSFVDVSPTAKEAGFRWPVAVTRHVWDSLIEPTEKAKGYGQDLQGRLWDVLWMLRSAIRNAEPGERLVVYDVIFQDGPGPRNRKTVRLWAAVEDAGDGSPAITIMLPEDY